VYFIVSLRVYVRDYVRASVSGLLRPFLSCGFYPLNLHSFIHTQAPVCTIGANCDLATGHDDNDCQVCLLLYTPAKTGMQE